MLTRIRPRRVLAVARQDLPGPVDVINLIHTSRFAAYRWYALFVSPALSAVGGRPLWMGKLERALHGEPQADKFLIVRYPSHRRFLAMTLNPYYLAINRLREAGVRRFEASFTQASHTDAALSGRRTLVAVHFHSAREHQGEKKHGDHANSHPGALEEVRALVEPVAGELVYATRAIATLGFLDPPLPTDPAPLTFGEVALFAVSDGEEPDDDALLALVPRLQELTDGVALQVYRRESPRTYLPGGRRAPERVPVAAG